MPLDFSIPLQARGITMRDPMDTLGQMMNIRDAKETRDRRIKDDQKKADAERKDEERRDRINAALDRSKGNLVNAADDLSADGYYQDANDIMEQLRESMKAAQEAIVLQNKSEASVWENTSNMALAIKRPTGPNAVATQQAGKTYAGGATTPEQTIKDWDAKPNATFSANKSAKTQGPSFAPPDANAISVGADGGITGSIAGAQFGGGAPFAGGAAEAPMATLTEGGAVYGNAGKQEGMQYDTPKVMASPEWERAQRAWGPIRNNLVSQLRQIGRDDIADSIGEEYDPDGVESYIQRGMAESDRLKRRSELLGDAVGTLTPSQMATRSDDQIKIFADLVALEDTEEGRHQVLALAEGLGLSATASNMLLNADAAQLKILSGQKPAPAQKGEEMLVQGRDGTWSRKMVTWRSDLGVFTLIGSFDPVEVKPIPEKVAEKKSDEDDAAMPKGVIDFINKAYSEDGMTHAKLTERVQRTMPALLRDHPRLEAAQVYSRINGLYGKGNSAPEREEASKGIVKARAENKIWSMLEEFGGDVAQLSAAVAAESAANPDNADVTALADRLDALKKAKRLPQPKVEPKEETDEAAPPSDMGSKSIPRYGAPDRAGPPLPTQFKGRPPRPGTLGGLALPPSPNGPTPPQDGPAGPPPQVSGNPVGAPPPSLQTMGALAGSGGATPAAKPKTPGRREYASIPGVPKADIERMRKSGGTSFNINTQDENGDWNTETWRLKPNGMFVRAKPDPQ